MPTIFLVTGVVLFGVGLAAMPEASLMTTLTVSITFTTAGHWISTSLRSAMKSVAHQTRRERFE